MYIIILKILYYLLLLIVHNTKILIQQPESVYIIHIMLFLLKHKQE